MTKKWKVKKSSKIINLIERKKNISSYQLSSYQVDAILELRLQKLTAFGINEIEEEITKLSKSITDYNKIINSKKALYNLIISELEQIKINFHHQEKQKLLTQY